MPAAVRRTLLGASLGGVVGPIVGSATGFAAGQIVGWFTSSPGDEAVVSSIFAITMAVAGPIIGFITGAATGALNRPHVGLAAGTVVGAAAGIILWSSGVRTLNGLLIYAGMGMITGVVVAWIVERRIRRER